MTRRDHCRSNLPKTLCAFPLVENHRKRPKREIPRGSAPADPPRISFPSGSGPRHAVFSDDGRFAYLFEENGANLDVFQATNGLLASESLERVRALSDEAEGFSDSRSTEVALHPSGKLLFVATRLEGIDENDKLVSLNGYVIFYRVAPMRGNVTFKLFGLDDPSTFLGNSTL